VNLTLLLGALWTIPAGVAIGFNPKLARIAQPLAQIAASVPATALFPVVLLLLIRVGGGLGLGSIVLLLLGTQWYILFNVIAGAIAIPTDLKECCSVFQHEGNRALEEIDPAGNFSLPRHGHGHRVWRRMEREHYRGIFSFQRAHLHDVGLGATISQATDAATSICCWPRP
jgi:NitT/TauT family transport system permease protein